MKAKQEEPEEYEVQHIVNHKFFRTGKAKKHSLQFLVKWKGYPNSDNTWEPESALKHAQDIVDQYWAIKGGGNAARAKCEKLLKGENDESEDQGDGEEASEVKPAIKNNTNKNTNNKRRTSPVAANFSSSAAIKTTNKRRKTTAVITRDGSSNDSEDIEVPPVTTRKTTKVDAAKSDQEDGDSEEDYSESDVEDNFRSKSNNWVKETQKVVKVSHGHDIEKDGLFGLVRWRDGKLGRYKTSFLAKKCPELLIKYYEKRLTFETKNSI